MTLESGAFRLVTDISAQSNHSPSLGEGLHVDEEYRSVQCSSHRLEMTFV